MSSLRLQPTKSLAITAFVLTAPMLIGCGPSDFEKEKLAFEKRKYEDEQRAKADAARQEAQDQQNQLVKWRACRASAESDYDSEFNMWGEPVSGKTGVRNGPANQLREMKDRLQRRREQCDHNFPKGIAW